MHWIFVESGAQIGSNVVGPVEADFFAEGHEGIREFAFKNAHDERSREPRFPFGMIEDGTALGDGVMVALQRLEQPERKVDGGRRGATC